MACGGHRPKTLINGASEKTLSEFHHVASFFRRVDRRDEWPHVGDVVEELLDGSDTIGCVAIASKHGGKHFEEVFDVAEEEIILVAVVSVERGAADFGAVEDVLNRDGLKRPLLHECDEGVAESVACSANAAVHFFRVYFRDRFLFSSGDDDFQFGGRRRVSGHSLVLCSVTRCSLRIGVDG